MKVITPEHAIRLAEQRAAERDTFCADVRETLRAWFEEALRLEPFPSGAFATQLRHEILTVEAQLGDPRAIQRRFRRSLSWKKRKRIFARDDWTCRECGFRQTIADVKKSAAHAREFGKQLDRFLTIDHVIPECEGGTSDDSNLRTLCSSCNGSKGNSLPAVAQVSA